MKCKPFFAPLAAGLVIVFFACRSTPQAEPAAESAADAPSAEASTAASSSNDDDFWTLMASGETAKARELFKGKVDVHSRDARGRTPLHAAAELGDADLASFLITLGAEVDAVDNSGRTPLAIATANRDAPVAAVLSRGGADIFQMLNVDKAGRSPAGIAVTEGGPFLDALLNPASVEETDDTGRSLLHLAAAAGNVSSLEKIAAAGAVIPLKDNAGKTALDLALDDPYDENHMQAAEKLILAGAWSASPIFPNLAPAVRTYNYNIRYADGTTPLHFAAREGYTGLISFLLNKGAKANTKNGSGATPLHEAARGGRIEAMKILVTKGLADVNAQDAKGNTALHIAIPPEYQLEAIKVLVGAGASPNIRDLHGESPLHVAVTLNRSPEIIQALLAAGSDVGIRNMDGKTPLYLAVESDRIQNIPLLISYGSDIFAADNLGVTPFEKALGAEEGDPSPVLPALITAETVNQFDSGGNTMLHLAVSRRSSPAIIGMILDRRANVNARNKEGDSSLHIAVRLNEEETGKLLLSRGADIFAPNARNESSLYLAFHNGGLVYPASDVRRWMTNDQTLVARDGLGNSALHYAAQWKLDAHIPFIVEKGADMAAVNATGEPPLFDAVKQDSPSTIQILLGLGAALGSRDYVGNSALHTAVRWDAKKSAKTLLDAGIDIDAHALNGKTALHDAVRLGLTDMENLLVKAGADLEARDGEGNTPFFEAVLASHPAAMERLADAGADTTTRNARGDTPLHIAVALERNDLVTLLLRWGAPIHAKNAIGVTPFETALATSPRMVSALLTKDRLNTSDDEGSSPLHIAVEAMASVDMLKIIVDLGGRLSAVDNEGRSPLRAAADLGAWEQAKFLADAGADPFSMAADSLTPADIAMMKGPAAVSALFSGKAINARDASGNTILHVAARYGKPELITMLLELGANKTLRNISQESPADIAGRWSHAEAAALLSAK